MPTIYDIVNSKVIASYYDELNKDRIPYLGQTLFPSRKKTGLKLEWIKGAANAPVALMPSAFDTKPTLRDRIGVKSMETRMPFFREAMRIGEEERQQLLMLLETNNQAYVRDYVSKIFDDVNTLVTGAAVQPERMIMSLLTKGVIEISAPDDSGSLVNYHYNYDRSGEWQASNITELLGTDAWDKPDTCNPIADILEVKRTAAKNGVILTRGILTTKTWLDIMNCKAIRMDMNVDKGDRLILTDADMMRYLSAKTGITFVVYDKFFKDEAGVDHPYLPDNNVVLLPAGTLGTTWYGTTPEEADLMSGNKDADVTIVDTGVAILTKKESLPVNVITSVSEIVLPSFERMLDVFVIRTVEE